MLLLIYFMNILMPKTSLNKKQMYQGSGAFILK